MVNWTEVEKNFRTGWTAYSYSTRGLAMSCDKIEDFGSRCARLFFISLSLVDQT